MIKTFFKHSFVIIIVALLQVAILPNLATVLKNLDVILVVIIFAAVVFRFYIGVIYALLLGFFLELYSALPFGIILLCYLLVLYFVYLIFQKVLTNKSFYSLLGVTFIGTLIHGLFLYLFKITYYFLYIKDYSLIKNYTLISLNNTGWQVFLNMTLALILFVAFHFGSKQFNAGFIDTTNKI